MMGTAERIQRRVAVAILNWNGAHHLRRFLPSVMAHADPRDAVVVIDNGSDDDSLALLAQDFPEVHSIQLPSNAGFAGGYNEGLSLLSDRLDAEWYLLLNSDVEVTEGWVQEMVAACTRHGWSAAQPKMRSLERRAEFEYAGAAGGYMDRHGHMFCAGRLFDSNEVDHGQYDAERAVFWASGAALLVSVEAWNAVGGLDEDFFAHMEEIDLCWRLRNRGHIVGVATGTHVYHLGGGTLAQSSPRKTELNFRNNLYLLLKNDHRAGIHGRLLFRMVLDGIAGLRFLLVGDVALFRAVIRAHAAFRRNRHMMQQKRDRELQDCRGKQRSAQSLAGRYSGSVALDYFLRQRRRFSELPPSRFS